MYWNSSPRPSYELTWYGSSYSELGDNSSQEHYWNTAEDVFSRFWWSNELNGEVSDTGGYQGDWLGESESCLAQCWGEVISPSGYDTSEMGSQTMDAVDEPYGSSYGYDGGKPYAYCSRFADTLEEDVHSNGWPETQPDILDEKRICESVFGYWPCLLQVEQESQDNDA